MPNLDITKKFRSVENLKTSLLSDVAALFENLQSPDASEEDISEIITDMAFNIYILSDKLGIDAETLEYNLIKKLKLEILKENSSNSKEARKTISHLQGHRL